MFVILTTADTEIQALAAAVRRLPDDFAAVRARNANELLSAGALERFVADELPRARAVMVRVLGGRPYFAEGFSGSRASAGRGASPSSRCPASRHSTRN